MKPFDQWAEDLADHLAERNAKKFLTSPAVFVREWDSDTFSDLKFNIEKVTVTAKSLVVPAEYIFEQTYDVEFCHDEHLMTIDPKIMESLKMMLEEQIVQAILTAPSSSPEGVMSDAKVIA